MRTLESQDLSGTVRCHVKAPRNLSPTTPVFRPLKHWHRRVSRSALVVLVASTLLLAVLLLLGVIVFFWNLEQDATERQREEQTAAARIRNFGDQLRRNVHDYAKWDDALQNLVLTPDPDWAEGNIGSSVQSSLGYDVSLLIGQDGMPFFGQLQGRIDAAGAAKSLGPGSKLLIDQARQNAASSEDAVVAVIKGPQGLLIAAANAIVPEDGSTLQPSPGPPAVLLFAKRLDHDFLAKMEQDFGLVDLTLLPPDGMVDGRASLQLSGPNGRIVGQMVWVPREFGRQQLLWLIPALIGIASPIGLLIAMAFGSLQFSRALHDSETRLQDFIEASSDWLWETDEQLRLSWLSSSFERITGLRPEDRLGLTIDEMFPSQDLQNDWQKFRSDIEKKRAFRDFTYFVSDDSGSMRVFRTNGRPATDAQQKLLGYRGTGRDITKEWHASLQLREAESEFRSLVDNLHGIFFCRGIAGDGLHGYDKDAVLVFGGGTILFSLPHGASRRVDLAAWENAIHPKDRANYLECQRRLSKDGLPFQLELRFRHPVDGTEHWARQVSWAVEDGAKGQRHLFSYIIDVTEQRAREAALTEARARLEAQNEELQEARLEAEQANLAKSQFLAAMSHEIRTPMTGVLGMADLLVAEPLTLAQRRYVDTIRSSGSHLLSIINDILDFSRIEAGRLELERIDFAPLDILHQVQSLLMPQAIERGLSLRLEVQIPDELVVQGDPTRLRQILVNLCGNALKFTARGEVAVSVEERITAQDTLLRFEVRDTGIGIPAERQSQLFQAFTQADISTNRHYGGSGLGLAICKRLVEIMAGTIGVESQPNQGSTFWFELPLLRSTAPVEVVRDQAGHDNVPPLRVLVVDDVTINRELLVEMLSRQGHRLDQAENGAQAVALAERGGYDVVLMDVQMPVMDGMEATRQIRQLPGPAGDVPILALTANVMESERARYLSSGMNRCLTKPVVWSDLYTALALVADGRLPREPIIPALPSVAPATPTDQQPLLDQARLNGMASKMPPVLFQQMLARGLTGAEESCRRLQAALGDEETIIKEAHRLRGTAGTFGLAWISALAGLIEDEASRKEEVHSLVAQLQTALEATAAAIRAY